MSLGISIQVCHLGYTKKASLRLGKFMIRSCCGGRKQSLKAVIKIKAPNRQIIHFNCYFCQPRVLTQTRHHISLKLEPLPYISKTTNCTCSTQANLKNCFIPFLYSHRFVLPLAKHFNFSI